MPISPKQSPAVSPSLQGISDAIRLEDLPKLADHIKSNGLHGGAQTFDVAMEAFFLNFKKSLADNFPTAGK